MTTATLERSTPKRRRSKSAKRWAKRLSLGILGLGVTLGIVKAWLPEPVSVDLALVRRSSLDVEVQEDGQTRVRERFAVTAPIGGILRRIELEAGMSVARGDVIAQIEPPEPALLDARARREAVARLSAAAARERRAQSMTARAIAARESAVREARRARALVESGALARSEQDRAELDEQLAERDVGTARSEHAAAIAEVAAARAVVDAGKDGPARVVVIAAPIDGRVLRVIRDSGGPIAAGASLLELGDPHALEVVVDVLSRDAARIAPQMEVAIENWGGDHALRGRVQRVEPSAFTRISALGVEEQRVNVIVEIEDPPRALGDGFRVDARIFTWRGQRILTVPASSVFRDHDQWAVYTVEEDRARLRSVTIGHRGRLDVEVIGGLAEGAAVVRHPTDRVADGVRVRVR